MGEQMLACRNVGGLGRTGALQTLHNGTANAGAGTPLSHRVSFIRNLFLGISTSGMDMLSLCLRLKELRWVCRTDSL